MRLGVIYIFHPRQHRRWETPHHQPIEHLASLSGPRGVSSGGRQRNRQAWRVALEQDGPTALVLSRQNCPWCDGKSVHRRGLPAFRGRRGRSCCWPPGRSVAGGESPRKARGGKNPGRRGQPPGWELFPCARRRVSRRGLATLDHRPRGGPGASVSLGWHRFIGDKGRLVTLDRYGASRAGRWSWTNWGSPWTRWSRRPNKLEGGGRRESFAKSS